MTQVARRCGPLRLRHTRQPDQRDEAARIAGVVPVMRLVLALAAASPYTSATRYDVDRRVVGTIAPDPDATGVLKYAAVRNGYDADGRLVKVESGELATWQSEAVAPSAWTDFTIHRVVDLVNDADGRKIRETVSSAGTVLAVTQYSYDGQDRIVCKAVRMDPATWAQATAACVPNTGAAPFGPDRITRTNYIGSKTARIEKAVGTSRTWYEVDRRMLRQARVGSKQEQAAANARSSTIVVRTAHGSIEGWELYSKYSKSRGLRVPPISLLYDEGQLYIHDKKVNSDVALDLLRCSHQLSPLPDIRVTVKRRNFRQAVAFMQRVHDDGLCTERWCLYEIVN